MKYLDTIVNSQPLSEDMKDRMYKAIQGIEQKLEKHAIVFTDENAEMVFCNHIVALVKRTLNKECIMDIDEALMTEVSPQAFAIADDLLEGLFTANGCVWSKAEVFLVATHIHMYLETKSIGG